MWQYDIIMFIIITCKVQESAATLFNFGPELGATDFRKALVDFLSHQYQTPVSL